MSQAITEKTNRQHAAHRRVVGINAQTHD